MLASHVFGSQASESGLGEDEFIFQLVEMVTGIPVDASIFDAPA